MMKSDTNWTQAVRIPTLMSLNLNKTDVKYVTQQRYVYDHHAAWPMLRV